MVAYSFKARFADNIREGFKTQTIRAGRARHARPGEMLQLFTGMRTAHCKKICEDVRCTAVMSIVISFDDEADIERITTDQVPVRDLDAFARADGFTDASDMALFWCKEHGWLAGKNFHGVVIEWAPPRMQEGL